MLSEQEKRGWEEIDRAAMKAGGYVCRPHPLVIEADYRAMSKYCAERGIEPIDLTDEEFKRFQYGEPFVYV